MKSKEHPKYYNELQQFDKFYTSVSADQNTTFVRYFSTSNNRGIYIRVCGLNAKLKYDAIGYDGNKISRTSIDQITEKDQKEC